MNASLLTIIRRIFKYEKLRFFLVFGVLLIFLYLFEVNVYNEEEQEILDLEKLDPYEEADAYQNLYRGVHESYKKSRFKLVKINRNEEMVTNNRLARLDKSEINKLFSYLYSNRAFLSDVQFLKEFELSDNDSIKIVDEYSENENKEAVFLTFGIVYKSLLELKDLENEFFDSSFSSKCDFKKSFVENKSLEGNVLASFCLVCQDLVVHLPVFYSRGDFFWISHDDFVFSKKVFGDKPRSLNK
jgi:hypothetical protein